MTWTCSGCGYNHGDTKVEEKLRAKVETVDYEAMRGKPKSKKVPTKVVEGWVCDRCGEAHPTEERPPGQPLRGVET